MSLHINNNYAKKRGIGKKLLLTIRAVMLEEHVDLVTGDFKGAAWRQSNSNNPQPTSIIADTDFPMPPGPTPLCVPGAVPGEWTDVCGFVNHPNSDDTWRIRLPLEKPLAFVKGIRGATTKNSYIWTLSAVDMLTSHEEITFNVSSSRKGPAPSRLPKKMVGTTMKVTIHFHPCHPYQSSCFHEQRVRRVKDITS